MTVTVRGSVFPIAKHEYTSRPDNPVRVIAVPQIGSENDADRNSSILSYNKAFATENLTVPSVGRELQNEKNGREPLLGRTTRMTLAISVSISVNPRFRLR
jgi:hypothetical protein